MEYMLRKVFSFVFTAEGAVIYIYDRMYIFILLKMKFVVAIRTTP